MHVPHSPRHPPLVALIALACLVCAVPTTAALAQQPDPAPLWKAYPLNHGTSTGAKPGEHPTGAPLRVPEKPRSRPAASTEISQRVGTPLVVAIAFYGALASLAAMVVGAATLRVIRRRAQPVTCEISWSPGEHGHAFRALAQLDGEEEWLVAQSRRFERASPDPPAYDAASHAAYDELLRDLYADGWQPYERGREWWATRLRRTTTSGPTATRDG